MWNLRDIARESSRVPVVGEDTEKSGCVIGDALIKLGLEIDHEGGDHRGEQADLCAESAHTNSEKSRPHNHEDKIQILVEPLVLISAGSRN